MALVDKVQDMVFLFEITWINLPNFTYCIIIDQNHFLESTSNLTRMYICMYKNLQSKSTCTHLQWTKYMYMNCYNKFLVSSLVPGFFYFLIHQSFIFFIFLILSRKAKTFFYPLKRTKFLPVFCTNLLLPSSSLWKCADQTTWQILRAQYNVLDWLSKSWIEPSNSQ